MSEDQRTLWIGNLHEKVTEELLYELCLQTGPIEKLIMPTEEEKGEEKHKGHAYILFKHPVSVKYASDVLDGTSLFAQVLELKARGLPFQYKSVTPSSGSGTYNPSGGPSNRGGRFDRFDNSSLRGGFSFNKSNTWHGQNNSFTPRGRGGYRGGGGNGGGRGSYGGGYGNQGGSYSNSGYNSQSNYGYAGSDSSSSSSSSSSNMDDKRQRLLQQQALTIEAHRQIQQGVMNMAGQMYNSQQQQQQQQWTNSGYNMSGSWGNQTMGDQSNMYQQYGNQYSGWYQQQQ